MKTAPGVERPKDSELRYTSILVIDDAEDCRDLLAEFLSAHGANVECAGDALEGLSKLQQKPPDILISDIGMPNVDGYELMRRVRALPATDGGETPAVALTAYSRPEDRERALQAGFQLHVAKPFELDSFLDKLVALLEPREQTGCYFRLP